MTRHTRFVWSVLAVVVFATLPATAGGDASILFGQKELSGGVFDTADVDSPLQVGVAVTVDVDWPVFLAFDLLRASDDENTTFMASTPTVFMTDVETLELDVGVRKFWGAKLQRYVGGGLAFIELDATQSKSESLGPGSSFNTLIVNDSDSSLGYWANVGLRYRLTDRFHVGFDVRYSDAEISLTPEADTDLADLEAGGTQYGVALGFSW